MFAWVYSRSSGFIPLSKNMLADEIARVGVKYELGLH